MHRKSLEAAEALKDDSGGSDRDDEHSKASDISSSGNPSSKSSPNGKSKRPHGSDSLASPSTPATSNSESINHNSATPNSSCASTSHVASSPTSTPAVSTHSSLPVHHLIESKSMLASPTHPPPFHHDSDNEAFRWVGDPISFIRCEHI